MDLWDTLLDELKREEGFRERRYVGPAGFLNIGYGFNLDIPWSQDLCDVILEWHVKTKLKRMSQLDTWKNAPVKIQVMLLHMAYQMGVHGVWSFKKMLVAIHDKNWAVAYDEAKDSAWYRATPERAYRILDPLQDLSMHAKLH